MTFTWLDSRRNLPQISEAALGDHPCPGNHAAAVTAMCRPKGKKNNRKLNSGGGGEKKKEKKSIVTAFRGRGMKTGCNRQSKKRNSFNCSARARPPPAICSPQLLVSICIRLPCALRPAAAASAPAPEGRQRVRGSPASRGAPAEGHRCR